MTAIESAAAGSVGAGARIVVVPFAVLAVLLLLLSLVVPDRPKRLLVTLSVVAAVVAAGAYAVYLPNSA